MHGVKRAFHDGEDRDGKHRDISVRDVDVNQHFFFVLTSSELDDEFKSSRAYQEEICAKYQGRGEGLRGTDWISSTKESKRLGKSGDIGIFAVAQFGANPAQPDDEVLDWWPHKEGILVIKLRPGLICENAWWGLRVRLFWNKEERFINVHEYYVHLHSSPYRIVGRLHGIANFQAHVALEKATVPRLTFSAEKALREFERKVESGDDPELKATADDYGSMSPGFECESKAASIADDDDSTEVDVPSAEAQLLADEAEEEAERDYTRSDPQGFGLGSLMSRARRFGMESDASAPGFE
ncbi:hypothetical protein KC349_g5664 [Hortaea werneckii]|nr:hypothetical protein KC349_g5664 [Hortaea werneckii]